MTNTLTHTKDDTLTPTERRALTELLRARLMLTRSGRARLARLLAKAGENATAHACARDAL